MEGSAGEGDGETSPPPHPQLTGVVIITLPPPDDPSAGKTISVFTLTSDHQMLIPPPPQPQPHHAPQVHESRPRIEAQNLHPQSLSSFRSFFPKIIVPILGVTLVVVALYFWFSLPQDTLFQLRDGVWNEEQDSNENKSENAFLFPLYRNPFRGNSVFGDFELKLGRLKSFSSRPVSNRLDNSKLLSTSSKIDATSVMPVVGNIYPDGLYYTYFHVGNPPRPYFLDMDSGSDLTWIQCDAPCMSCAKGAHPFYKPLKANIISPKDSYCVDIQRNQMNRDCDPCHQCDYEIEYADHSSSMGVLARDVLHLKTSNGSFVKSEVVFGCAYDQQGLLLNTLGKTDGILGLSRAKISLPSQLASQGVIKNVVGHCIATDASGGGYLFLGDDFVPYAQMTWVSMLHNHDLSSYQTEMVKVSYGSRQIGLGNAGSGQGRLIFDSGSSYTYFTEEAYNNLIAILDGVSSESIVRDVSDTSLPICWKANSLLRSVEDFTHFFKPLNLQLQSKWWKPIKFKIPPEGYLVTNSKGNVCLGILNGRNVQDGSTFILGDVSLRGLLVVYDNVKEKIGWIRADCVKPRKLESHPLYRVL